jgi:hypothetical protein
MATKLSLINNALILIGDLPLASLTSGTRAQIVATSLYDNIVQNELSKFRWGFARRQVQLSRALIYGTPTPIVPLFDWDAAYRLPIEMSSLITLNPRMRYQVYSEEDSSPESSKTQVVYVNYQGDLYADMIFNVPEDEWPVYFSKMIEYALAMDFAPSIRDSATSMQLMSNQYLNASRMARFTDSQQHPQTPIQDRPFINVRY